MLLSGKRERYMFPGYSTAAFGCDNVEAQGLLGADKTLDLQENQLLGLCVNVIWSRLLRAYVEVSVSSA